MNQPPASAARGRFIDRPTGTYQFGPTPNRRAWRVKDRSARPIPKKK